MDKEIVYRVEDGMDREKILCTTYQMRNFYMQFRDGFFTNLDVMNYIQHLAAAHMAKKGMNVLDVCCGRSLMLPLLRYYAKDIASYTGVDISKANIKEAMRGATAKNLEPKDLASYYPFRVGWKLGNVAEMSKVIPAEFADFVIYTSAIEHMHPVDGAKSLAECYKVMKPGAKMFLSCPNTPGNGYQTQYRAHVYEWGYDELKSKLAEIGFSIVQEVGLVTSVREMDEFYSKQEPALRDFYTRMKAYVPSAFLTTFMAIPFPLNLHRRVLADLECAFRKSHECSAAGMRRRDGRANVGAKVDALDGSGIGSITLDDTLKVMGDMRQAHRERTSGTGLDAAIGTAANLATPLLDNPPTRMGQTGVNAQDNQANLPSPQVRRKTRPRALFTNVCSRITQQRPYLASKVEP